MSAEIFTIPRARPSHKEPYEAKIIPMRLNTDIDYGAFYIDPDPNPTNEWVEAQLLIADYADAIAEAGKSQEALYLIQLCKNLSANGVGAIEIVHTAYEYLSTMPDALRQFNGFYYQPSKNVRHVGKSAVEAIRSIHSA